MDDFPLKRESQRSRMIVQGQVVGQRRSDLGGMILLCENLSL